MPTDTWPAPSSEADVLTWVRRRARRITLRRRILKTTPAAAVAVALAVALASTGGTATVSTTDKLVPADTAAADEPGTPTTSTSTTSTTAPVRVYEPRPPERVFAPAVGSVPVAPAPATYADSHPVLTDPEDDAFGSVPATGSDRSLDIVAMDVTANAASVTTSLRILDITAEPRANADGRPTRVWYATVLQRNDGHFSFAAYRDLATGAVTAEGTFWYPVASAGSAGGWSASPVPARASIDLQAGIVMVTADFADMNRAMQQDASQPHPPIGLGAGVRPSGETYATGKVSNHNHGLDVVAHADPGYTCRLGE